MNCCVEIGDILTFNVNIVTFVTQIRNMKRIAVFPGSFDPITIGHVDLIKRFLPLYDEIIIAIGVNSKKFTLFDLEKRNEMDRKGF